jgi:ammonia channel protein AmtB
VVLTLIRQLLPLRVSGLAEQQGLDIHAPGEEAYNSEFSG